MLSPGARFLTTLRFPFAKPGLLTFKQAHPRAESHPVLPAATRGSSQRALRWVRWSFCPRFNLGCKHANKT